MGGVVSAVVQCDWEAAAEECADYAAEKAEERAEEAAERAMDTSGEDPVEAAKNAANLLEESLTNADGNKSFSPY